MTRDEAPRALVTGASGFIGGAVARLLRQRGWSVLGTALSRANAGRVHLDVRDPAAVSRAVGEFQPQVVVHAAAEGSADRCEDNPERAWEINVKGTQHLAEAAERTGAKLVLLSSDYVFDGSGGPFDEKSVPRPINVYARAKVAAEAIAAGLRSFAVARTTVVYGWDPASRNFLAQLVARLQAGLPMQIPTDQCNHPTYVEDLAEALARICAVGQGIFHVVGPEAMERQAFALLACEVFDLPARLIEPVSSHELGQRAARPRLNRLLTPRLAELGIAMRGPRAGLEAARRAMEADSRSAAQKETRLGGIEEQTRGQQ